MPRLEARNFPDKLVVGENRRTDFLSGEGKRTSGTLRELGFRDRTDYNAGLLNADISYASTINFATGGRVYFCRFDYPVGSGDHLIYLLESISPEKTGKDAKNAAVGDWILPDEARYMPGFSDTALLNFRHERIPQYKEFDENHRSEWLDMARRGSSVEYRGVFGFLVSTAFIEPETYAAHQFSLWRKEQEDWRKNPRAGVPNHSPAAALFYPVYRDLFMQLSDFLIGKYKSSPSVGQEQENLLAALQHDPRNEEYDYQEINKDGSLFDFVMGSIAEAPIDLQTEILLQIRAKNLDRLIDPTTGKTWVRKYYKGRLPTIPRDVRVSLSDDFVTIEDQDVAAQITLGGVHSDGTYVQNEGNFIFSDRYQDDALYPLIAWEDGADGQPSFLDQKTAMRLVPSALASPGMDVLLGRVALANMVSVSFPRRMYLPKAKDEAPEVVPEEVVAVEVMPMSRLDSVERKPQEMAEAQMPVVISLPNYAKRMLESDSVAALRQKIISRN